MSLKYKDNLGKTVKLSVLIPALNASKTIGIALLSACLFSVRKREILVYVDGGRTDSPFLRIAELRGWVTVFRGARTEGLSFALNFLLEKASGQVVARLDADDILLPFWHSSAIRLLFKERLDYVFASSIFFKGIRQVPVICFPQALWTISPEIAKTLLALRNPFVHPTMVALKSSIQRAGGYREGVAEDYDLWLRAALIGARIKRAPRYGVMYRVHSNQITSQRDYSNQVKNSDEIQSKRKLIMEALGLDVFGKDLGELDLELVASLTRESPGFRFERMRSRAWQTLSRRLLRRSF